MTGWGGPVLQVCVMWDDAYPSPSPALCTNHSAWIGKAMTLTLPWAQDPLFLLYLLGLELAEIVIKFYFFQFSSGEYCIPYEGPIQLKEELVFGFKTETTSEMPPEISAKGIY